ncbi:hypothetical protein EV121DRAFT_276414 [Schizophyllum commune]
MNTVAGNQWNEPRRARSVHPRRCTVEPQHAPPTTVSTYRRSHPHAWEGRHPSHGLPPRASSPDDLPAHANRITIAARTTDKSATPSPLHTPNNVAQTMPKPGTIIQPDTMQLVNRCALRDLGGQDCFVGKALSPAILCYSTGADGRMYILKVISRASVVCLCEG